MRQGSGCRHHHTARDGGWRPPWMALAVGVAPRTWGVQDTFLVVHWIEKGEYVSKMTYEVAIIFYTPHETRKPPS